MVCGLSANLGCRSELCCTRLAENTGCKKSPKIRHLVTMAQVCWIVSSQLFIRHVSTIRKKLVKQQYLLHMSSEYGGLRPINGLDRFGSLGTPANFNGFRVLASLLQRRRSSEANQTLHDVWPSPSWAVTLYIFGGSCPRMELCQVQNSRYVEVLRSPTVAALLHRTPAAGVSETLQHGARMELTELSQRVSPIFGWAAISLSIGPHSSFSFFKNIVVICVVLCFNAYVVNKFHDNEHYSCSCSD